MSFASKHVLVTGGGRGIGRAIAAAFAEAGAQVTITGRDQGRLDAAVAEGFAHQTSAFDLSDEAATRTAIAGIMAQHPIDILIANAGAVETAPFHRSDAGLFRRMIDANLMSMVFAAQAVLPGMTARGQGRIVAIASTAGLKGYAYDSAYCAAKHAVIGLVRVMAIELAGKGVTVNAICPGYTATDMVEDSLTAITERTGRARDAVLQEMLKAVPLKRLIAPEEVAAACLWLASDAAASVTGAVVPIAGGEI